MSFHSWADLSALSSSTPSLAAAAAHVAMLGGRTDDRMHLVHHVGHVFIRPWKTDDVIFRVERPCLLQDVRLHPEHALTLMETRVARRLKHSWRSDKFRRDAWTLMARMNDRRTRGTILSGLMLDSRPLLPHDESLYPTEERARAICHEAFRRYRREVLEPGQTLTVRVRNGCQPLTWFVAVVGLEAAWKDAVA